MVRDKRVKDAVMNSTIQNMFERGELRKDHPLQRKPDRWSNSDKEGLIVTIIKGEDIDSIKVCEQLTGNGVILWVIDGLQRLTVLDAYRRGIFKIGKRVEFPVVTYQSVKKDSKGNILRDSYDNYEYELVECDLRGKYYKDLPVELREKFDNYKIDMVKHLDCTDEEIGYHIRRYNKQKSMNASENAVTYMDHVAKEVKRISSNNPFFKNDTYKEAERNNGTIDRIVAESVMCMFHLDKWQKQSKKIGTFLNDNSNKEEFDKLDRNLKRLETIYDEKFKEIFTAKDSFIWFTIFDKFTDLQLDDKRFADFLRHFMDKSGGKGAEAFYGIDKKSSTKDKSVIIKKLNSLEKLMLEFLHIDKSDMEVLDPFSFVKQNVNENVTKEDMEQYEEVLDELTKKVDRSSNLLTDRNRPSLAAMAAYSFMKEIDLDDWIVEFFEKHNTYRFNQKENYQYMRKDLDNFVKRLNSKEKTLKKMIRENRTG